MQAFIWLFSTLIHSFINIFSFTWNVIFIKSSVAEERPKISELATVPIQPAQWYSLGLTLGLEEDVLNSIEVGHSHKHAKCKRAMFRKWLESTPSASWNDLIKALVQIGEKYVAEKVKEEFSPSQPSDFYGSGNYGESSDLHGDHHHSNNSAGGICDFVSCSSVPPVLLTLGAHARRLR